MRLCLIIAGLLIVVAGAAYAQNDPASSPLDIASPSDVAPPPEIVIPAYPEEIPVPSRDPVRIDGGEKGAKHLKIGTVVTGEVELFGKVRIQDADEIHPRAVPVILAVMDPREGPWHPHFKIRKFLSGETPDDSPTPVVFVKVMLPPAALASMKIRREEIDFEYGDLEVNIDSDDGLVTIDYDD